MKYIWSMPVREIGLIPVCHIISAHSYGRSSFPQYSDMEPKIIAQFVLTLLLKHLRKYTSIGAFKVRISVSIIKNHYRPLSFQYHSTVERIGCQHMIIILICMYIGTAIWMDIFLFWIKLKLQNTVEYQKTTKLMKYSYTHVPPSHSCLVFSKN